MKISSDPCEGDPCSSEFWLVCSVTKHLVEEGYRVRLEVSNMGQSIDVVATKNRWITAIEAKRHDWRRALEQCRAHMLVADYIVVALALRNAPSELSETVQRYGWGLLLYNRAFQAWGWDIKPRRNERVWLPQRRRFSASLKKVKYAT